MKIEEILLVITLVVIIIITLVLALYDYIKPESKEKSARANTVKFSQKDKDIIDLVSQLSDLMNKLEN